jgi:hypothetical protein
VADARARDAFWHLAAAAVAYGVLAVWWTWPMARHLSDHVVDGVALHGAFGWLAIADVLLYVWTLAWDVHALAAAPLSLLDANVFYPATWALARADHFLGHLPLFAPVYVATRNPVLGHQAALFLCFPLSALAMHYAVRAWTMSTPAAVVAGVLFGFAPWRFTQLGHLQLQATMYLPVALVAAERVVRGGSRRAWVALVVATGLQALCSVYLAFIAALAVAAMALGATADAARARRAVGVVAVGRHPRGPVGAPVPRARAVGRVPRARRRRERAHRVPRREPAAHVRGALESAVDRTATGSSAGRASRSPRRPSSSACQRHEAAVRRGLVLVVLSGWVVSLGYARAWTGGEPTTLPLGWLAAPGAGVRDVPRARPARPRLWRSRCRRWPASARPRSHDGSGAGRRVRSSRPSCWCSPSPSSGRRGCRSARSRSARSCRRCTAGSPRRRAGPCSRSPSASSTTTTARTSGRCAGRAATSTRARCTGRTS